MSDFRGFPKIGRLEAGVTITEKIDGTNAAVGVRDDGTFWCQSRKRVITPDDDNFEFAAWVHEVADDLIPLLGPGVHYGEWYGRGIQRNYGMKDRRWALFNTRRWIAPDDHWEIQPAPGQTVIPTSLHAAGLTVVPTLFVGAFDTFFIDGCMAELKSFGSHADGASLHAPAEGIMLYLHGPGVYVKHPFESGHKGN